jgi:hypothetical protein
MPKLQPVLRLRFNEVMESVRAAGWWVALDYRPEGGSRIFANRLGFLNRQYTELKFKEKAEVEVYERWFAACAANLQKTLSEADTMLAALSHSEQVIEAAAQHVYL